jgi:CRP-like cAMP-binding protein
MYNLELLTLVHAREPQPRWNQPDLGDWADMLAKCPLFKGVSKRRLRKLARSARQAEFAPGETILYAGDPDDVLHIILSGHVKTSRGDGRLRAGEYFGEVALTDGHPRSATVTALSYVHVLKLPSGSILNLARQHPAITLTMLRDLTTRLHQLEAESAQRGLRTPRTSSA